MDDKFILTDSEGKVKIYNHILDVYPAYDKGLKGYTLKGKMNNWRKSWDKGIDEMQVMIYNNK